MQFLHRTVFEYAQSIGDNFGAISGGEFENFPCKKGLQSSGEHVSFFQEKSFGRISGFWRSAIFSPFFFGQLYFDS
jgi:hypothetical protein